MPFGDFRVPQGALNAAQKAEAIHKASDFFASHFGEGVRRHAMVPVDGPSTGDDSSDIATI